MAQEYVIITAAMSKPEIVKEYLPGRGLFSTEMARNYYLQRLYKSLNGPGIHTTKLQPCRSLK
jgi:hypothetical protein